MEEIPHLDRPIRVIGRYALYGKLAAGGMATVHFGRLLGPAGFSRTVAIKRLHPQFAKDPEFVAMFLDEARLAARIQHPNVVATVDVVSIDEELFLVMDYIRGESFSRLLRASRKQGVDVSLGVIASVATGMLHGLHAAHEAKDEQGKPLSVVHRDVSPQNVLVGVDGVARVLDFGVAKAAARVQVTRDGQMKGKLSYMSPEQILGKGVDRRTDIFAAGIVIWEALTGRRLFDAEDAQEVLRMIMSEEIPPPSAVVPSINRNVDGIVMKALARDPAARYATARQFAIAMEAAANLSSTREVGEWVELVAGETLMNREQAVAEIEAVSDASIPTETSPGFMKTLNDRLPVARAEQPASEWDEGPTRVFDAEGAAPEGPGDATRVHVPHKQPPPPRRGSTRLGFPAPPAPARALRDSAPPKPTRSVSGQVPRASTAPRASIAPPGPAAPPPRRAVASPAPELPSLSALGFDDENEKTNVFDPTKHGFDDENETTNVFDPTKHGFDDENETTNVFDSEQQVPGRSSPPASVPSKRPAMRLADLPTDPRGSSLPPPLPPPSLPPPSLPRASGPPPLSGGRIARSDRPVRASPLPAAGQKPPQAPSVIVKDQLTDPAIFRQQPVASRGIGAWVRAIPGRRTLAVIALAAAVGLTSFIVVLTWPRPRGTPAPEAGREMALAEPADVPAVTPPVPPPEPVGIDPSTLPVAEKGVSPASSPPPQDVEEDSVAPASRSNQKSGTEEREGARDARKPGPTSTVAEVEKSVPAASPEPALPAGEPAEVENPYGAASSTGATPASPEEPSRKAAPAKSKSQAKPARPARVKADCSQPFVVDDKGIRRVRPECL